MGYELIISEKPQAAEKIAKALGDKSMKKVRDGKVNYYTASHNGKEIRVASAVGHLYILGEKGGESWTYPVFDTEWKPIWKVSKTSGYTADYIACLTKLGKNADEVTVAADFDIEGEVIGLNVVRFALGRKDANRMKFSTLTKDALVKAYETKQPTLEWGQAKAGETRHNLDWYYGINLSRAFTQAIKKGTNQFKVLSTGRVQAPALHFLAERERKIKAFQPENYAQIYLEGFCKNVDIRAEYELPENKIKERKTQLEEDKDEDDDSKITIDKSKIFDLEWAEKVVNETKGNNGKIKDITAKKFNQKVPTPFDLTSLQMEASNMFGISPKRTLEIAQKLYVEGLTSYPRTSSQKLPKELELDKVINKLSKQPIYSSKVKLVLEINPSLKPNEGKKTDPAHPAIHPTGEIPTKVLEGQEFKIYDLVVKRFFAVFGRDAVRETNTIRVEISAKRDKNEQSEVSSIKSHEFVLKGTRTVEANWHLLYEPYLKFEDIELPKLEKGADVENKNIEKLDKETSPPKRYTDASIIKELEKRNLGTKATRAEILSSLRDRGYVVDKSIKVTELGIMLDEVLASETPELVDENLTREFDSEMDKIREGKSTPEKVLEIAKKKLQKILGDISKNEIELGIKLAKASNIARMEMGKLGKCPKCEKGTIVTRTAKVSKKRFAGCNNFPNCKNMYPLPQLGKIETTDNPCTECGCPVIVLLKEGKRPWRICINMDCPTKKDLPKFEYKKKDTTKEDSSKKE